MRASTARRNGRQCSQTGTRSITATTANCGSVRLHIPHRTCWQTRRTPPSHTWADPSSWLALSMSPHPGQRLPGWGSTGLTPGRQRVLFEKLLGRGHARTVICGNRASSWRTRSANGGGQSSPWVQPTTRLSAHAISSSLIHLPPRTRSPLGGWRMAHTGRSCFEPAPMHIVAMSWWVIHSGNWSAT